MKHSRALIVAIVGLAAACGGGSGSKTEAAGSTTSTAPPPVVTTVPTSSPSDVSAPAGTGGDSGRDAPAEPSGSASDNIPSPGPPPLPPPPPAPVEGYDGTPVAAGTYRYSTTGRHTYGGQVVELPAVTTLVVDAADADLRQTSVRDLRDVRGNGPVTTTTLLFRPDGLYVEQVSMTTMAGSFVDQRHYRPSEPRLIVPASAAVGDRYEYDMAADGVQMHVVSTVQAEERLDVDGKSLRVFRVDTVNTLAGSITGQLRVNGWVAPAARLILREEGSGEVRAGLFAVTTQWQASLQSLTPA